MHFTTRGSLTCHARPSHAGLRLYPTGRHRSRSTSKLVGWTRARSLRHLPLRARAPLTSLGGPGQAECRAHAHAPRPPRATCVGSCALGTRFRLRRSSRAAPVASGCVCCSPLSSAWARTARCTHHNQTQGRRPLPPAMLEARSSSLRWVLRTSTTSRRRPRFAAAARTLERSPSCRGAS